MKVLNNLDLWGKLSLSVSANDAQKTEDFALLLSSYAKNPDETAMTPGVTDFILGINPNVGFLEDDGEGGYYISESIKSKIDANKMSINTLRNEFDTMMGDETSITGVVDTFNEIKLFLEDYNDSDLKDILDAFVAKNSVNIVGENFELNISNETKTLPFLGSYFLSLSSSTFQYWMQINGYNNFELARDDGYIFKTFGRDVEFANGISLKVATFSGNSSSTTPTKISVTDENELEINNPSTKATVLLSSRIYVTDGTTDVNIGVDNFIHPNINADNAHLTLSVPSINGKEVLYIDRNILRLGTDYHTPILCAEEGVSDEKSNIYISTDRISLTPFVIGSALSFTIKSDSNTSGMANGVQLTVANDALKLTGNDNRVRSLQLHKYDEIGTTINFSDIKIGSSLISHLYGNNTGNYHNLVIGTTNNVVEVDGTYYASHIELRASTDANNSYIAIGTDVGNNAIKIGTAMTLREFVLDSGNGKVTIDSINNRLNVNNEPVLTSDNVRTIYTFTDTTHIVNHSYGPYPKVTVYELGSGGVYSIVYADVSNKDNGDGSYELTVGVTQTGSYVLNVGY